MLQDGAGRWVQVPAHVGRIICLCPSITETLFTLGLGQAVVGITSYCLHPAAEVATKVRVGGTKKINYSKVAALKPDLILAEKEENTPEMVNRLAQEYTVVVLDVVDVSSALGMITTLGELLCCAQAAAALRFSIQQVFQALQPAQKPPSVGYLIWNNPLMAAGAGTYIDSLLQHCGWHNVFATLPGRYPVISAELLQRTSPDYLLLSSEPYSFKQKDVLEIKQLAATSQLQAVDGEMFSWYGSRMLLAAPYLQQLVQQLASH